MVHFCHHIAFVVCPFVRRPSVNFLNKRTQTCPYNPWYYWICQVIDMYSYQWSKQVFIASSYLRRGVNQRWTLQERLNVYFSTCNQRLSPHVIALKYLISLSSTPIFPIESLKTDNFHRKTYFPLGRDKSCFLRKKTP
jgi:hypothetical protein